MASVLAYFMGTPSGYLNQWTYHPRGSVAVLKGTVLHEMHGKSIIEIRLKHAHLKRFKLNHPSQAPKSFMKSLWSNMASRFQTTSPRAFSSRKRLCLEVNLPDILLYMASLIINSVASIIPSYNRKPYIFPKPFFAEYLSRAFISKEK